MGENGDSVLKVVQLFIDNINESTKSTSKELDKLSGDVGAVKTKINTPPRNEELFSQIKGVEDKVDTITTSLVNINGSIKTMIHTVRVVAAVLTAAVLLAGGIIHYSKSVDRESLSNVVQKIEYCLGKIAKEHLDKVSTGTDE